MYVSRLPSNTSKNRYKDVICYDKTRVQLNAVPGVDESDYIHANYVDGYNCRKHFILTQGKLTEAVFLTTPYHTPLIACK